MSVEIRRFREEEYPALLSLIDTAFSFEQGNFLALLPKLYKKEDSPWENNLCAFEDGVPAAAVGAYYDTVTVGGQALSVCGIGNVGVHPDYRGRGYMISLMEALTDEMDRRGADISVLGGDRFRYAHFGYEGACPGCIYSVGAHTLGKQLGLRAAELHEVTSADDALLGGIEKLYRSADIAFARGGGSFYDTLLSWKNRIFCSVENGEVTAYCTVGGDGYVGELRAGNLSADGLSADGLGEFLLGVMEKTGRDSVNLFAGMNDLLLRDCASKICDEASVRDCERILVLRWESFICACLTAQARKTRPDDVSCVIRIRGAKRTEQLRISVLGGDVSVTSDGGEPDYDFTWREASDVMLKAVSARREELPAALRALFPLRFSVSQPDMV